MTQALFDRVGTSRWSMELKLYCPVVTGDKRCGGELQAVSSSDPQEMRLRCQRCACEIHFVEETADVVVDDRKGRDTKGENR